MSWLTCPFGHASDWIRVEYEGIWYRQCPRCHARLAPILVNGEASTIQPAKVPPIVERCAQKAKKARVKKPQKSTLKLA